MSQPSQADAALAPSRRARVLEALGRDGAVRVSRLTEELGVTHVTIRRDLAQLEQEGLLLRVHGGAVAVEPQPASPATGSGPSLMTGTIAVLVPSLDYYWPAVVRGIEAEAHRRGMEIVLRGASYELQDERPALDRLLLEEVGGFILAPNTDTEHAQDVIQWLAESGRPSVLVEREAFVLPGHEPVESVRTDHSLGAVLAARHLAGLGHERVGLVLSRNSPTSRRIATGWHEACAELGLTTAPGFEPLLPDRRSPEFSAAIDTTLDTVLSTGLTGLLVHSDPEAMAIIDLALNRGISVPDELSIIAYDDEVAQLFNPAISAVSPPRAAVGEAAADLLIKRMADRARPVSRILLNPTLNVRESTAQPRLRSRA